MNTIKSFFTLLLSGLFFLASCSSYQTGNVSPADAPDPPPTASEQTTADVDLCELLQSPDKYERKVVRVKGFFCDCFEDGTLYPANCPVQKKIWVDGSLNKCGNAGRVDAFRETSKSDPERRYGGWTFGVIAVGRLTGTKGGYGHMNQYDYLFEIDCLEHAELFDRTGKRPAA